MNTNPYAAPVNEPSPSEVDGDGYETLGRIARRVFLAWEKLRLGYIGALAVLTVLFALLNLEKTVFSTDFWPMAILGAIGANLCYFAGPAIETYVTWLGYRGQWLRRVLFLVGTSFSCVLVVAVLTTVLLSKSA